MVQVLERAVRLDILRDIIPSTLLSLNGNERLKLEIAGPRPAREHPRAIEGDSVAKQLNIRRGISERRIRIPISNRQHMSGYLTIGKGTRATKYRDACVIFVHGLTSDITEAKYYLAARTFAAAGISALRFSLYSGETGCRKLRDCTIQVHSEDLHRAVAWCRGRGFERIVLVGHSLGAPTILVASIQGLSGVVLWDGTSEQFLRRKFKRSEAKFVRSEKGYLLQWGTEPLVGKRMVDSWRKVRPYAELVRELGCSVRAILAGEGTLAKTWQDFASKEPGLVTLKVIAGATHNFEEGDTVFQLVDETVRWVGTRFDTTYDKNRGPRKN